MNQRFEEFYSQVGLDFENFQRVTVKKEDMEKFAELIARECAELASQCAEWAVQNPEDHILQRFGLYKTPAQVKMQAKVEE